MLYFDYNVLIQFFIIVYYKLLTTASHKHCVLSWSSVLFTNKYQFTSKYLYLFFYLFQRYNPNIILIEKNAKSM